MFFRVDSSESVEDDSFEIYEGWSRQRVTVVKFGVDRSSNGTGISSSAYISSSG